jgi:hypothetical protein
LGGTALKVLGEECALQKFEPFFLKRFENGSTHQVLKTRIEPFFKKKSKTALNWAAFIKTALTD